MFRLQLAAIAFLLLLFGAPLASAQTCTTSWTAAGGGSWSAPGNWSAGVPTASSTACITLDGTYTVTSPTTTISVNELVIGASSGTQTLQLNRDLALGTTGEIRANGILDWSAGYMTAGTLKNSGRIHLTGSTNSRGVRGTGVELRNEGTIEWSSTGLFYVYSNARVENAGLWNVTSGGDLYGSSGVGTFVNESGGTFRKSGGGTDATRLVSGGLVIENEGAIEALNGTIQFERPSTHTNASFAVADGAAVVFQAGIPTFEGTTTGSPVGALRIQTNFSVDSGAVWNLGGTGMEWASGYFEDGTLTNTGRLRLTGASNSRGIRGGATLRNQSTVEWSESGLFYVYQNARVENTSLWTVLDEGDLYGSSGAGTFVNTGTLRKEGAGTMRIVSGVLAVENSGTLDVREGTMQFERPSTHTSSTFAVASGAALIFQSGGVHFEGTTTGAPAGALRIQDRFTAGDGAVWNLSGTGMEWASNYFEPGESTPGDLTNTGLVRLTGTSNSRGVRGTGVELRNEGTIEWSSTGLFYVYSNARVENAGLWNVTSGGDLYGSSATGTFVNESDGTFRKSGGGTDATRLLGGGLVIENEGTFEALNGTIQFERPSTHINASFAVADDAALVFVLGMPTFEGTTTGSPEGILRIQTDFAVGSGAVWNVSGTGMEWTANYLTSGTLTNAGRIRLTGTSNSRGVRGDNAVLRNEGTVEWESTGLFYIYNNARVENTSLWTVLDEGDLYGSSGAGTFVNTGTLRKEGAGTMRIVSGVLAVENSGTLDVREGTMQFDRPSTHTNATFSVSADALLAFATAPVFSGTVGGAPEGRVVVSGGLISTGGTVALSGTGLEWTANYLTSGTLTNAGRIRLTGTSNSRGVRGDNAVLRNEGTVEWESTGLFYIYNSGRVENAGLWDVTSGGDLYGTSGVGTFVNESDGIFRKSGGGTDATRLLGGGLVIENEGVFDVLDGTTLSIERPFAHREGSTIQGDGTVNAPGTWLDNAGDTAPDGDLAWGGAFTPQATSALHIDIGGTTPATEYDQLVVTGAAQLNGQLVVDLDDSYTPSTGDTFTVLTATSLMGGFDLVGLTDNGISLYPTFSETDLTLTASEGVPTISGGISVTPDQIVNGETAEMTITGTGFAPDVSVRFLCSDCIEPDRFGEIAGLVRSISPTEIVVTFSVVDLGIAGLYDVVVTDPRGGSATAPIAITPGDLTVIVEAVDPDASERGADRGTFLVRMNARLAAPLDVQFSLSGTATRYTDYALSSSRSTVRIPRGETTAVVAVVPLADSEGEGDETVVLTLDTDDVDYAVGSPGTATITIADGPPPTTFDILASQPHEGGAGPVTLTISGQNIGTGATAQLLCSGTPYNAITANAAPSGTSLSASFDLTGQAPASCDLTVSSGGNSKTLSGAFRVMETIAPDLALELVSPERRRRGRKVRHRIIVTNRGNVDAFMVPVEIIVNAGASIDPEFDVATPQDDPEFDDFGSWDDVAIQQTVGDKTYLPLVLPVIPAGSEIELSFNSDASQVSASVLTPYLAQYSPATAEGVLAPEYVDQFARVAASQIDGDVALCWGKKFLFALVNTLGGTLNDYRNCVVSATSAILQLTNQVLGTYAGSTTPLSGSRTAVNYYGAIAKCAKAAGKSIPWSRGVALAWNISTAVYDAYYECPKKPKETETEEVASFDPNDKLGPAGVDIERYFRGEAERLFYTVRFENKESATAPAAEVFVTDTLDVSVYDPATFSLGPITFGDSTITPPPGLQAWSTTLDLRPERPMLLQITGSIDAEGLIQWAFTTLDPNTMDLPEDPLIGFLPPNATAPEGEGAVSFYVGLHDDLADGTVLANDARIVFDLNEPIDTPVWSNTIDRSSPTSRVAAIYPSTVSDTTLVLSIASSDDGSGVLDYDVYASQDGGPFALAFTAREGDTAFEAERGIVYSFFSIARDRVGNMEPPKTEAEATTRWPVDAAESPDPSLPDVLTLADAYPNPTRGDAVVQFGLPDPARVDLRVYDVQGREVARLTDDEHPAGWHRLPWNADGLAPGVYILRLQVGEEMLTQRLTVVR